MKKISNITSYVIAICLFVPCIFFYLIWHVLVKFQNLIIFGQILVSLILMTHI